MHTGLWKMGSGLAAGAAPRNDGFGCALLELEHRL